MPSSVIRLATAAAISVAFGFGLTTAAAVWPGSRFQGAGAVLGPTGSNELSGGLPMIPAGASQAVTRPGISAITSVGSLNWAGYAMTSSRARFTAVRATFFVPYLNCTKSPGRALSSAWVGMDGFLGRARSVEQGGIAANCGTTGKAAYFGWWETFPRAEVRAALKVAAGDSVTASVTYIAKTGNYRIALTDNTSGASFGVQRKCPHVREAGKWLRCPRNSAEIISEAPATRKNLTIARLADYGAVSFGAISITDGRGAKGGIVSSHWNATKITQLRDTGGPVVARPTPTAARTFDTYWLRED